MCSITTRCYDHQPHQRQRRQFIALSQAHLWAATRLLWSNQYPCPFMPSSGAGPTLLLLALDCRLLLPPLLAAPPWLAGPLSTAAAAKAASALLLLPPPCMGEALRLRWWCGMPLGEGLLAGWAVKEGPLPSGYT